MRFGPIVVVIRPRQGGCGHRVKARGLTEPGTCPILYKYLTAKAMTSNHSKLGPREKGRKSKGKRKPQAAKAARARRTCLLVKLGVK
jgi:hypothetical protein